MLAGRSDLLGLELESQVRQDVRASAEEGPLGLATRAKRQQPWTGPPSFLPNQWDDLRLPPAFDLRPGIRFAFVVTPHIWSSFQIAEMLSPAGQ